MIIRIFTLNFFLSVTINVQNLSVLKSKVRVRVFAFRSESGSGFHKSIGVRVLNTIMGVQVRVRVFGKDLKDSDLDIYSLIISYSST